MPIANVNLPSDPYGPHAVRYMVALDEVRTIERGTQLPLLQPDPELLDYLTFAHTEAAISGSVSLNTAGLEPGAYSVRLLRDDGYGSGLLAGTTITSFPGGQPYSPFDPRRRQASGTRATPVFETRSTLTQSVSTSAGTRRE